MPALFWILLAALYCGTLELAFGPGDKSPETAGKATAGDT